MKGPCQLKYSVSLRLELESPSSVSFLNIILDFETCKPEIIEACYHVIFFMNLKIQTVKLQIVNKFYILTNFAYVDDLKELCYFNK